MQADALICSHPRSGGRWFRHLLAHYLAERYELGVPVTPASVFHVVPDHHDEGTRGYPAFRFRDRPVPLLAVCHQPYSWRLHRGLPVLFLARNAYDVVVSAYHHLTTTKGQHTGPMGEFIRNPKLGVQSWIEYMNGWAPHLLRHPDATLVSYRELSTDPAATLRRALRFLDEQPDEALVRAAVRSAAELRGRGDIRTGQEGTFWDHLEPLEIFAVQEALHGGLSDAARHLLESFGVEIDPLPRGTA